MHSRANFEKLIKQLSREPYLIPYEPGVYVKQFEGRPAMFAVRACDGAELHFKTKLQLSVYLNKLNAFAHMSCNQGSIL
jgi:hypothetical protein